jgi:cytochrome c biogenesis protein CcmG, thiol:disulfide interchange protein DsbE
MTDETISQSSQPRQPAMSTATWVVLAVGVVLIVGWLYVVKPKMMMDRATKQPGVGQPLPVLELQPLTGATEGVSLAQLRGKVTLINYWGPWCGFCIVEFPHLVELWDQYRGNPEFVFLSVSSDGVDRESVLELRAQTEKFLKSRSATFPTYVDTNGTNRQVLTGLIDTAGHFGYPTTVLLDRAGIIRAVWIGYEAGYENQMQQLVSHLLSETTQETSKTDAK